MTIHSRYQLHVADNADDEHEFYLDIDYAGAGEPDILAWLQITDGDTNQEGLYPTLRLNRQELVEFHEILGRLLGIEQPRGGDSPLDNPARPSL